MRLTRHPAAGRRRVVATVLLGALVGAVSACSPAGGAVPAGGAGPTTAAPTSTTSTRSAPPTTAPEARPSVPSVPVRAATPPPRARVDPPVRLRLADVDVEMAVEPVGVAPDGTMQLPPEADVAGWYRYGAAPGADRGTVVLAAHVDSAVTGLGPLVVLGDVARDSTVTVTTADGRELEYTVTDVDQVAKSTAPVGSWFDREGPARLVVITCGGAWNAQIGHYADNVVLTAEPVGG